MPVDPILLSGPSITHREIECVADAVAVGWNMKGASYLDAFQKRMAGYTGRNHAFATSSCTGAMHLALLALGIGPGDEVLVPEIADISVASCVAYTGAKPVFCDVDPHTLCLSAESAAANITPRTRAMILVHLYGQICDMASLLPLAERHRLFVLENATQGLGSLYRGRPAGSFGHFSAFSFNGAKAVVAGEGGILLASDPELFSRAVKLGTHGRSAKNPFLYDAIGYNYAMSNLQAALGFAQMERIDDLLAKKRQIFAWYKERLHGVPGIRLNAEVPGIQSCPWMTTLFVDDASMIRHHFLQRLLASGVICRPVFYPLSSMPMFTRADNPVAYGPGLRALVLPSGHNRTEEEVEYIAGVIKELLARKDAPVAQVEPTGWLKYKAEVLSIIAGAKAGGLRLPFTHGGEEFALRAVTAADAADPDVIAFMTELRKGNPHAFLSDFPVTGDTLREMLRHYIDRDRDFLLFFIMKGSERLGHMGLDDFAFQEHACVAEGLIMRPDAGRGGGRRLRRPLRLGKKRSRHYQGVQPRCGRQQAGEAAGGLARFQGSEQDRAV